jgi:hypothetical protein
LTKQHELQATLAAWRSHFPDLQQTLLGRQRDNGNLAVCIADWPLSHGTADAHHQFQTPPSDDDSSQSSENAFADFVDEIGLAVESYHVDLPHAPRLTPPAPVYAVAVIRTPPERYDALSNTLRSCLETDALPEFAFAAVTRENRELVLLYSGWKNDITARYFLSKIKDRLYRDVVSYMLKEMRSRQWSVGWRMGEVRDYLAVLERQKG